MKYNGTSWNEVSDKELKDLVMAAYIQGYREYHKTPILDGALAYWKSLLFKLPTEPQQEQEMSQKEFERLYIGEWKQEQETCFARCEKCNTVTEHEVDGNRIRCLYCLPEQKPSAEWKPYCINPVKADMRDVDHAIEVLIEGVQLCLDKISALKERFDQREDDKK